MDGDLINYIVQVGVGSGIAIYLVRWVTTSLNGKLRELIQEMRNNTKELRELKLIMKELIIETRRRNDRMIGRP